MRKPEALNAEQRVYPTGSRKKRVKARTGTKVAGGVATGVAVVEEDQDEDEDEDEDGGENCSPQMQLELRLVSSDSIGCRFVVIEHPRMLHALATVVDWTTKEFIVDVLCFESEGELRDAAGADTATRHIDDCTVREMTKVATPRSVESDALRLQEQSQHLPPAGDGVSRAPPAAAVVCAGGSGGPTSEVLPVVVRPGVGMQPGMQPGLAQHTPAILHDVSFAGGGGGGGDGELLMGTQCYYTTKCSTQPSPNPTPQQQPRLTQPHLTPIPDPPHHCSRLTNPKPNITPFQFVPFPHQ